MNASSFTIIAAALSIIGAVHAAESPTNLPVTVPAKRSEHDDENAAYSKGKTDAEAAIAKGKPFMETYGFPAPWRNEYAKVLKEKCGVELVSVAGCCVDDGIMGHSRGVNEVTTAWMKKKYGDEFLKKAGEEAMRRHKEKIPTRPVPPAKS